MKRSVKRLNDEVNISGRVETSIIRTVKNAKHLIENDDDAIELMKKIESEKEVGIDTIKNKMKLNKLIDYGLVSRMLNNNIVISGIGLEVLRDIESKG